MTAEHQSAKLKVFISYSRRDLSFVDHLQSAVKTRGIDATVDRTDIAKGEAWWKRIQQLITEADTIVFVLSPASAGSEVCQQEVNFAETLNKRIVPIVAEDVAGLKSPDALARLNYIFFIPNVAAGASGVFEEALDDLVNTLETDVPWIREHTRIGALAQRWQGQGAGKGQDLLLRGGELDAAERWSATRPVKAPNLNDAHIAFLASSRRAATLRQRWVAGISTGAAVVAIALAGVAYIQSEEARRQRATTVKISVEAQTTEAGLLSEAARGISDQPGGGNASVAMLLAIEGMPDIASDDERQQTRPLVAPSRFQLDRAWRNTRERIVVPHEHSVNVVAWSPDGRLLATGSGDRTARVVEAASGKEVSRVVHENAVNAVMWSPDGRWLATGSDDKTARVIEAITGKEIVRADHSGAVLALAWSTDGRMLATGSGDINKPGEARVLEAMTGKQIARVVHGALVSSVAWSPDGRMLATGSWDKQARVLAAVTGREVANVPHDGRVYSLAWSPDGRWLATGSEDTRSGNKGEARVVEAATGKQLIRLAHDSWVNSLAWSPDGRMLATGFGFESDPGGLRVVEVATQKEIAHVAHDSGSVTAVAWSPDGRMLASASSDKTVRIIDAATGKETVRVAHDGWVNAVAWSPDGRTLATGSRDVMARVIEATMGRELARVVHGPRVVAVAWNPDGRMLATGSWDKTARVVEAATGKEIARVVHGDEVSAVAWSPDGRMLATGSGDKTARVVEAATGREVARVVHARSVSVVAWSPDGRMLATGSGVANVPGEVGVIDTTTGKVLFRVAHHRGAVKALAWSPDGRMLATGSADKTARVVEAATGKEIARITHSDTVSAVAWSPDGTLLLTGSEDIGKPGSAKIVEAATGDVIASVVHDGAVYAVAWSPPGAAVGLAIMTGSEDGTARIWRVYPTAQALVDTVKDRATRCLTPNQRAQYFLPPAPPTWCVSRRIWPYHGIDWQAWLPEQKAWLASGRQGAAPSLP